MAAVFRTATMMVLALVLSICAPAHAGESDLAWSTFLGGSGEEPGWNFWASYKYGICVDHLYNVYVAGTTYSTDFPITSGCLTDTLSGDCDVFIAKIDSTGSSLMYSTFLGGRYEDWCADIDVDPGGAVCVTGATESWDFPTSKVHYQHTFGGARDAFVTRLNAAGDSLLLSSFIGGDSTDWGAGIVAQGDSVIFLAGATVSVDFPLDSKTAQLPGRGGEDAFVMRLYTNGWQIYYSRLLGGSSRDLATGIAIGETDNAFVTGWTSSADYPVTPGAFDTDFSSGHCVQSDGFVTKLDITGDYLEYSTFLGESWDDWIFGIAVDGSGCAYVTGMTYSEAFPTTPGAYDTTHKEEHMTFVTKLGSMGQSLAYSTFLGDWGENYGCGIALDDHQNVYLTGMTDSYGFPVTPGAFEPTNPPGNDAFVTKINSTGSALAYSTYLGAGAHEGGHDIAVDDDGNAYVVGCTSSDDFPITSCAFDCTYNGNNDVFVSRLNIGSYFAPPEPIQDLATMKAGSPDDSLGHLHLSWSPSVSDAGLTHYVVYRSTDPASAGDSLSATTDTEFLDQYVTGDAATNYCYMILAVDTYGKKSESGNMAGEFDRTVSPGE